MKFQRKAVVKYVSIDSWYKNVIIVYKTRQLDDMIDRKDCRVRLEVQNTHRNQSTAMMRLMSSVGRPTEVSTMTMVTSPAWGIPAAPILAAVAVMLCKINKETFIACVALVYSTSELVHSRMG